MIGIYKITNLVNSKFYTHPTFQKSSAESNQPLPDFNGENKYE